MNNEYPTLDTIITAKTPHIDTNTHVTRKTSPDHKLSTFKKKMMITEIAKIDNNST